MITPAYKIAVGGKAVDTTGDPQASTVVGLTVALDLDTPADAFMFALGNVGGLAPKRHDATTIELGYADDAAGLTQVITGTVESVASGVTVTRVTGYGGAAALLRTFVDRTFEGSTAGAIVRSLAGSAGVAVAEAEDGIAFPTYVVDGRQSAYSHMHDLADLCGFDLYVDRDGKLVFKRFVDGRIIHVFELTKHIIDLRVERTPARAGRVEAWGESPTSSNGASSSAWLTTDFGSAKGSAGSGTLLLLERPALRTRDAARTAADAALTAIRRRTLSGRLTSVGRPEVRLGDAIKLRGMADASLNTSFQVRGVLHRIVKSGGFTTVIDFRAIQT